MVPFALNTNRVPEDDGGKFFNDDGSEAARPVIKDAPELTFTQEGGAVAERPLEGGTCDPVACDKVLIAERSRPAATTCAPRAASTAAPW